MNFNEAVHQYNQCQTDENLQRVSKELCDELSLKEKFRMLYGRQFFGRSVYGIVSHGQKYNYLPCVAGGVKRLGIPEVAFSDGPRGVVMGRSTCFPVSMARGASFNDELEYEIGSAIADEVLAQGGNYFAGICINLLRNPRWGRAQETYGEDPYLLSRMGVAMTKAVQDKGIIACPKHFAANSIENIRFDVNVNADEKTMHEVYLPHFKACIDAGAMSIMGAYNLFRGDHCCESKYLLKDVLRDEWGFEGFTISDFLFGVHDSAKALKSGLDIEMPQRLRYYSLSSDLKHGKISEEDINNSVMSILRGLIKITPKIMPKKKSVIACKKHTELAKRAALEGTVLLKNNGILPLKKDSRVAIIGRYANKINVGDHGSSSVKSPYTVTPYEGLCNTFGKDNVVLCEGTDFSTKAAEIKNCDCVIILVGSDYKQEGENLANFSKNDNVAENSNGGDRYSLRISKKEVELIKKASHDFSNIIVDIIGGSAYIIEEWKDDVGAIFHSFYSGMEGGNAFSEILCGDANPSGHLPFTMAKEENDYPKFLFPSENTRDIEYEYYHGYTLLDKEDKKAAFPFGFGLSYTNFEYDNIKAKENEDDFEITLTVKNTGDFGGKTVVQVYAGADNGDHPKKLLKGFSKVLVKKGESETVCVTVKKDDLKFYNPSTKTWYLEDTYTFFVGQNSEDTQMCKV